MDHAITVGDLIAILAGVGIISGVLVVLIWAFAKGMSDAP